MYCAARLFKGSWPSRVIPVPLCSTVLWLWQTAVGCLFMRPARKDLCVCAHVSVCASAVEFFSSVLVTQLGHLVTSFLAVVIGMHEEPCEKPDCCRWVEELSRYSSSSLASGPRPLLEVHLQSGEKPKLTHRASMQDETPCTPYLSNSRVQNMGVLSLLGQGSLFSAPAQTPSWGRAQPPCQARVLPAPHSVEDWSTHSNHTAGTTHESQPRTHWCSVLPRLASEQESEQHALQPFWYLKFFWMNQTSRDLDTQVSFSSALEEWPDLSNTSMFCLQTTQWDVPRNGPYGGGPEASVACILGCHLHVNSWKKFSLAVIVGMIMLLLSKYFLTL